MGIGAADPGDLTSAAEGAMDVEVVALDAGEGCAIASKVLETSPQHTLNDNLGLQAGGEVESDLRQEPGGGTDLYGHSLIDFPAVSRARGRGGDSRRAPVSPQPYTLPFVRVADPLRVCTGGRINESKSFAESSAQKRVRGFTRLSAKQLSHNLRQGHA